MAHEPSIKRRRTVNDVLSISLAVEKMYLDSIVVSRLKTLLAGVDGGFGDVRLAAVGRRFAAVPVDRTTRANLTLRYNERRNGRLTLPFGCSVTVKRRRRKGGGNRKTITVEQWTNRTLRRHLLRLFTFIRHFDRVQLKNAGGWNESTSLAVATLSSYINRSLSAAACCRPIDVRRLALSTIGDRPTLAPGDVLLAHCSTTLTEIAFSRLSFRDLDSAANAGRMLAAAGKCVRLRSVRAAQTYVIFSHNEALPSLGAFLVSLTNLRRLSLGDVTATIDRHTVEDDEMYKDWFRDSLANCPSFRRLHLTDSSWFRHIAQPSARSLIGRLRSVRIDGNYILSYHFASVHFDEVKRMVGALPSDGCLIADFCTVYLQTSALQANMRRILRLARENGRLVKLLLLDLQHVRDSMRTAVESLPAADFTGRKVFDSSGSRSSSCWLLSDDQQIRIAIKFKELEPDQRSEIRYLGF